MLRLVVILYHGEQTCSVQGVSVINPLQADDIWQTLTAPLDQETE